ncbi:MAG: TonB-dependent receptor [Bacteroidetes bacterium]|nr:TonB-dependent receptor [Bacteroidota bacterium]
MRFTLPFFLLCFFQMSSLSAQTGVLRGTISDEVGLGLPGATIFVPNTDIGTVTMPDGSYILYNIPVGEQTIEVNYLGYQSVSVSVAIEASRNKVLDFQLEPGVITGDEVLVLGDRLKGQAKALNRQKELMNITNIVAADQIGRFPDANIGDAMKRIPGITMQGDQGEARNIIVRGLAPQLNSVTLNGDRIPSAEGDNRNIQMDLIPSDMIQAIEVNKAVTPDMDGDAIGGSVNLITRAAPNGFRLSVTGASGLNLLTQKPIWTGGLIVGDRFANDRIGFLVAASVNQHRFGSDNVEGEWEREVESPLSGEDIEVDPYLAEQDIRTYLVDRIRRSLQASLDFKLDDNNTIILRGMYNWRDDRENRFALTYEDLEPVFTDGTETITGWEGGSVRQTKAGINNSRNQNRRLEDQRVINGSITGDHLFGRLKMDWMASYSRASEHRPNERYIEFGLAEAVGLDTDFSNTRFPLVQAANPADLAGANWELGEITEEEQYTEEEDMNAKLDLSYPTLLGSRSGQIKVGGRLRLKSKLRDNNFFEYSPVSGFESLDDVETADYSKENFLPGDKYDAGIFTTETYLGNLDLEDKSLFEKEEVADEYLPENYDASEDVMAAYIMWTQEITKDLSFLAGVRYEGTSIEYTGNEVLDGEELITTITNTESYANILPGLHLRYALADRTIIRAAWTNTLARPNYYDLVPYRNQVDEDEEIFAGNPELDPTTSMNFDLMADHYFTSVGLISGGVFYKQIDDFIYVLQSEDEASGYDLFQPQNGGNADLLGFELSFQRQLDFLPGIWKGLGVYLNYTHLTSNAEGVRNGDGELRENVDLPGTSPNMFNASLSFETSKLVLRASLNYSDAYIDELADDDFYDRYYDEQLFLDFNASYAFTPQFRIFAEVNNITNQPLRYFQGVPERTMQMEYYNARFNLGLKYDLFK